MSFDLAWHVRLIASGKRLVLGIGPRSRSKPSTGPHPLGSIQLVIRPVEHPLHIVAWSVSRHPGTQAQPDLLATMNPQRGAFKVFQHALDETLGQAILPGLPNDRDKLVAAPA